MELFEALLGTRAMRRLKSDPVPDALILKILRAGQAAPSAGNGQSWGFIVVKDRAVKEQVQRFYLQAWDEVAGPHYRHRIEAAMDEERGRLQRQMDAAEHLSRHFHEVPVWIVACQAVGPSGATALSGASIYPAVQNMLLAARGLGLGSTLTARHMVYAKQVDSVFGLPEGITAFAILPIGWPEGKFGPVRRGPLAEIVHLDRWGQRFERGGEASS
jgi:nitroreductase